MSSMKEAKDAIRKKKSVDAAVKYWTAEARTLGVAPAGRRGATSRIKKSGRPMATAKALVREFTERLKGCATPYAGEDIADLSDLQELRVRLLRKHGGIGFPSDPHVRMLSRLELNVIDGLGAGTVPSPGPCD